MRGSKGRSGAAVAQDLLQRLSHLRVDKANGARRPHKPLLMLLAIQRLLVRGQHKVPFDEAELELRPLLQLYAPPIRNTPDVTLPFWHLQNDQVWEVVGRDHMDRKGDGMPTKAAFRAAVGRIPDPYAIRLAADRGLAAQAVQILLNQHFAPSLHNDLRVALGLEGLEDPAARAQAVAEAAPAYSAAGMRAQRNRSFRSDVLAAYGHRCAVTGFQALVGGMAFCLEAAHVHWHSQGGPSEVTNGLSLTPTLHKLFDHGAWTLDNKRRVLVSQQFNGQGKEFQQLRSLHGKPLRKPIADFQMVAEKYIAWHRDPKLGGVFREPALPTR